MAAELPKALFLLGPTASGKTALALHLADRLPLEIISIDSALVYREMDIGTAKPDAATRLKYPHHLVDIIDPTEAYSAARFCADARAAIADIAARGRVPLFTGGTMLYAKALTEGLSELPVADPALRAELETHAARVGWPAMHAELATIDPVTAARLPATDAQRIQRALEVYRLTGTPISALQVRARNPVVFPFGTLKIGLAPGDRTALHARIAARFDAMLAHGFIEEVRCLRDRYPLRPDMPSMRCVGYRQAWEFLDGGIDAETLREKAIVATRQLAKRQMTWLRSMREVESFECLDAQVAARVTARVERFLGG